MSGIGDTLTTWDGSRNITPPTLEATLVRIADALDRAYPPRAMIVPRVNELFDGPQSDPVEFVMDLWGETREDAEKIVATTKPQEDSEQPFYNASNWVKN